MLEKHGDILKEEVESCPAIRGSVCPTPTGRRGIQPWDLPCNSLEMIPPGEDGEH